MRANVQLLFSTAHRPCPESLTVVSELACCRVPGGSGGSVLADLCWSWWTRAAVGLDGVCREFVMVTLLWVVCDSGILSTSFVGCCSSLSANSATTLASGLLGDGSSEENMEPV